MPVPGQQAPAGPFPNVSATPAEPPHLAAANASGGPGAAVNASAAPAPRLLSASVKADWVVPLATQVGTSSYFLPLSSGYSGQATEAATIRDLKGETGAGRAPVSFGPHACRQGAPDQDGGAAAQLLAGARWAARPVQRLGASRELCSKGRIEAGSKAIS